MGAPLFAPFAKGGYHDRMHERFSAARSYDLERLSGNNCGGAWAQTFSYDAFGNISKSGSISWLPTYNSPVDSKYLTGWNGVGYDASGNLLNDPFNTYTWDAYGGLASVNGTTVTNDAFGRTVENQSRGIEIVYSPANGAPLAAMQGQSLNTALVPLPGGATAGYGIAGDFNYFYPDWLGSVRLLSGEGRTAFPIMAYAPFGEGYAGGTPNNGNFTAYGFPFTVFDSENDTGTLEDFMFRRYNPTQGSWISPDPAGLGAVDPSNPQSWNRYAYVTNNPNNYIDPLGLGGCGDARSNTAPCRYVPNGEDLNAWLWELALTGVVTTSYNYVYGDLITSEVVEYPFFDVLGFIANGPGGAANNGNQPQTARQKCLRQAYNTATGKAVQFLSPVSLTPLNPNWKQNWGEWGVALFGKGGGMFGVGIGTDTGIQTLNRTDKCRFVA